MQNSELIPKSLDVSESGASGGAAGVFSMPAMSLLLLSLPSVPSSPSWTLALCSPAGVPFVTAVPCCSPISLPCLSPWLSSLWTTVLPSLLIAWPSAQDGSCRIGEASPSVSLVTSLLLST